MKTAGTLFLEWYNKYIDTNGTQPSNYDINLYWSGGNLEKEKQIIIDSYNDGREHGFNKYENAEDYYFQEFEKK